MRFRTLLSLSLLVFLTVTGIAVITAMYLVADRHSSELADKLLASVTAQASQEVYAHSEHAVSLAHSLERMGPKGLNLQNSDTLALELADLLRLHPNISWISFSNPQGTFTGSYRRTADGPICINQSYLSNGKTSLIENTLDEQNHKTLLRIDPDSGYDPRTRPFYVQAVEKKSLVWLPPYIFYEQGIPGISCAVPVYAPDQKLIGVFSVDYDLNYLSELARHVAASPHSQVMVFSDQRILLAHSAVRVVQQSGQRDYGKLITPDDVTDPTTKALMAQLKAVDLASLTPGTAKSLDFSSGNQSLVASVLPMRLESGPLMYIATVAPKTDFAPTPYESAKHAFIIILIIFAAAGIWAMIIAQRISSPITTLVKAAEQIGKGNLDVSVSLGTIREFKKLSAAFHSMLTNLRDSVRLRTSLLLAREIQQRLLPTAPPRIEGFDIAGYSASCDETGGDYYDYILPRSQPQHLIVVLGDMMGHGLPSALFMAGARGALRSALGSHTSPATLLSHLNDTFYRDTDGKRFMTMCLVSFNLEQGQMQWASAGHDPPLIFDPHAKDFHEPTGGDVPLGVLENVHYLDYPFAALTVGQIIIIGSDGVWETYSPDGQQFEKQRLKTVVALHAHLSAEEIKSAILAALNLFRGTAAVRDDITFIVLKILPSAVHLQRVPEKTTPQFAEEAATKS